MVKPLRTSRKVATATVRDTVDAFLSSPRCANPNTRRAYTGVLDRVLDEVGAEVELGQVSGEQLAEVLERLWGERSPATWNRNRAAVAAWLSWCARAGHAGPALLMSTERRREPADVTRALSRTTLERALSRRDVPLREKTLWRMLFETAARASEVLALNIDDLDLDAQQRILLRLDEDLHRPPAVRRDRGPAHLRRQHPGDRHRLLPPRPRPRPTRHDLIGQKCCTGCGVRAAPRSASGCRRRRPSRRGRRPGRPDASS